MDIADFPRNYALKTPIFDVKHLGSSQVGYKGKAATHSSSVKILTPSSKAF